MTDQYADYEALRPFGEATHVPDDQFTSGGESRRQRSGVADVGYPDDTTAAAPKCTSCGASIPTGQTKCRFCLTNHLDAANEVQDTPSSECNILHVIHTLVKSRTFYGAVAKGSAACSLLVKPDSDPTVDDCQLIYDLDAAPAAQLADKWPTLPSAARATSESGEQLLTAARERTACGETMPSRHDGEHATFLYDETGTGIRDEDRLVTFLADADDDVWLVPAIALQHSVATSTENPRYKIPNRGHLECRECGQETEHQFETHESIPDETWTGQPIWECQPCGTTRYGPAPE